jgi:hypothetical protein
MVRGVLRLDREAWGLLIATISPDSVELAERQEVLS